MRRLINAIFDLDEPKLLSLAFIDKCQNVLCSKCKPLRNDKMPVDEFNTNASCISSFNPASNSYSI